jgi:tight adherence protein B
METIVIIVVAATLTFGLLLYGLSVMFGRNRAILAERLETYAGIEEEAALASDAEAQRTTAIPKLINIILGRQYIQKLEDDLAQADIPMRPAEYVLLRLVLAGFGLIISLFVLSELQSHSLEIIRAVTLMLLGFFVPGIFVKIYQNKRRNKFVSQLADALMLLTNSLRSGYGFLKGLELVAKEMNDPIAKELNRMLREINLGATVEQAMQNLGRRVHSEDLDIVISAYLIQKDVGGNLTEIMEKVAETIRERLRIQGDIKVLTAQGRLSGLIIGLLPVALFVFFMFNTKDYYAPMFAPPGFPIFGYVIPYGVLMLFGAFIWQIFGGFIIYKIISIKV